MEASDAFAVGTAAPEDDPFKDADAEFKQGEDPFAEKSDPPVVNAEGEPVEPDGPAALEAETTVASSEPEKGDPSSDGTELDRQAASEALPAATVGTDGLPTAKEPAPRKPKTGKNGQPIERPYVLLIPEGGERFKALHWYEDKDGKIVEKGAAGAVKRTECLVRGQREALRIGYQVLGSPAGGCVLTAVPAKSFKPRRVSPEIPPGRVRLKIN